MKTVSVDVPDVAFSTLRMDMQEMACELRRAAIVKWYELGMLSQGRSAEILGVSRAAFIDLLTKYRVSPFQYTDQELLHEIQ
jgi:predicted HTH domain antitoxin